MQKDDLIVKFGRLDQSSFGSGSLQPLADVVTENEDVCVPVTSTGSQSIDKTCSEQLLSECCAQIRLYS